MTGKGEEIGQDGLAAGGGGGGGRLLKRSRSSSSSSRSDGERTPCLYSYHRDGFGPMMYTVDFDEEGYKKRSLDEKKGYKKKRAFCEQCGDEVIGQDEDDGDGKKRDASSSDIPPPPPPLRRITPLRSTLVPWGEMVVALGSTVYVLGGISDTNFEDVKHPRFNLCRDVFYFETSNNNIQTHPEEDEEEERGDCWKRGPDMLNGRCKGKAVAVGGKIYVFGGNDNKKAREPWGEVFDPIKNKWKPLPPPPPEFYELAWGPVGKLCVPVVAYGSPEEKIMIGGRNKYIYHVKGGTWEQLDWLPHAAHSCIRPIGVGNILYWTVHGSLLALSMKTQRKYRGKIEGSRLGLKKGFCYSCDFDPDAEPQLVHLGGRDFCFFTGDTVGRRGGRTKVCCTKFRVSKRGKGCLKGSVLSRVACIVDQPLMELVATHSLLLDGTPGGIKDVEGSV